MACGCSVVSNRGDNVEWLLNQDNAILTDATPEALSDGILHLLKNDDKRQKLIESAMTFSENTRWDTEAEKVATFFEGLLNKYVVALLVGYNWSENSMLFLTF